MLQLIWFRPYAQLVMCADLHLAELYCPKTQECFLVCWKVGRLGMLQACHGEAETPSWVSVALLFSVGISMWNWWVGCEDKVPRVLPLMLQTVESAITGEEKVVSDEIQEAEKYLLGIEQQYGNQLPSWLPFRSFFGSGSGNYGGAK